MDDLPDMHPVIKREFGKDLGHQAQGPFLIFRQTLHLKPENRPHQPCLTHPAVYIKRVRKITGTGPQLAGQMHEVHLSGADLSDNSGKKVHPGQ